MSLTQDIANVVQAAENMTATVTGKMGQIDQRMDAAETEFDTWRSQKDLLGDSTLRGIRRMSIFQGFLHTTSNSSAGGTGSFSGKIDNLETGSNVYLHLKTPLNINTHNEMFWFHIHGYSYGSAKMFDEILTGYCYANSNRLVNRSSSGNFTPDSYTDTAGNVILRLLLPSSYYNTMAIDTMRVGNGRLFNEGDLDVKVSLTDTVEF